MADARAQGRHTHIRSVMKGCIRASLGVIRFSGSRISIFSSRSLNCSTLRRSSPTGLPTLRRLERRSRCCVIELKIRSRSCGGRVTACPSHNYQAHLLLR